MNLASARAVDPSPEPPGAIDRAFTALLDGPAITAPIAAIDRLRRLWLRRLGGVGRVLVRDREVRGAALFSLVIVTAFVGCVVAPLWLLILGPLIWGVPHLVADMRHLVVRTGYAERRILWLVAGAPLVYVGVGGDVAWGFVASAIVALCARAGLLRRVAVALVLLACAGALAWSGPARDVLFGHAHNFVAVAIWWLWRPRLGRVHWIPLALLVVAVALIGGGPAQGLAHATGGLDWYGAGMDADYELWRLAPGLGPELGLRLVLLFCFAQSIHYALWLHLIPDADRTRATSSTFRESLTALRRDLGDAGVVIAAAIAVGVALWAVIDLAAANRGYFRMALFHGHLEVMAAALLILEGRPSKT